MKLGEFVEYDTNVKYIEEWRRLRSDLSGLYIGDN